MKLFELTTEYHDELNPKLWDGEKLRPDVLSKLKDVAAHFLKSLKIENLKIDDIVMTGSLANYNWTPHSDIDIHLIADVKSTGVECKEVTAQLFDAKKDMWAEKYDITIKGFPIEMYVQDKDEPHPIAMGVYSLNSNKWIDKPKYNPPKINVNKVISQAKLFKKEIDKVVDGAASSKEAKIVKDEIKKVREKGLRGGGGEFSTGNLAFKELRNTGLLGKLMDFIKDEESDELSLESIQEGDDWNEDSNETPDRDSVRLQGLYHQSVQLYKQLLTIVNGKPTIKSRAIRMVGIASGVLKWKHESNEIRIPYYYDHRTDYSVKDEPSVIIVYVTDLTEEQKRQIYKISQKMKDVYKEQMKLKQWKDPLENL